ncbi:phage terminase large subunit family protein [Lysinibacillus sp. UGB7]|uniref:phage terminase large subunit family protein n=1 Tax=Lysinibacillus sp. UGB7 TaxID=3411039 RepID=UPI003B7B7795
MQKKQSAVTKSKSNWPAWLTASLKTLKPPEKMLLSEWAEKYRVLDSKSSAIPGPWRNNVTSYLVGIMDEFNNVETEEIIFVKPTQVGGTEVLQNALGYFVMQDPSPTMVVYPSQELAGHVSKNRLRPMFRISKSLNKCFFEDKSEELELQFDGMFITLEGANSPASLASKPIRYLLLDEVDKYPGASKKEADPIKLSRERTKTFPNRKVFMASTPTLRTGHIWKAKEEADAVKHYKVPCPHCGEYIELKFKNLRWPSKEEVASAADRAEGAFYACQECGAIINDRQKPQMLREGRWEVVEQRTQYPRKICFWMNTLYSPFVRFAEVAKEYLTSKDDPEAFQNFVNSWLAEPWEDTKLKTNADMVLERQTEFEEFIVPDWAEMLTAGVDVQETSLYWTIRAWGPYLTSQNIAHGQALNFKEIERVMNLEFKKQDGQTMLVQLAGIDSGDQTDDVYEFCARNSEWAIPIKGVPGGHSHFRLSKVNKINSNAYGMQLLLVDGGKYKDIIASRMDKSTGVGSWMVYKDCDKEYAEQVTAEHKVRIKGSKQLVWVPKTSHADNHYLDCEVYAFAVADVCGVRTLSLHAEAEKQAAQPTSQEQKINDNATNYNDSWLGNKGESWL